MGNKLTTFWNQSFFIAAPTFTDKDLQDQTGKVHLITGGYAGIGYHLARHLYAKNATIYLAGRSESKARHSIVQLKSDFPNSKGRLEFIYLDLADLTTVKPAVGQFLSQEDKLDVLVNNAGIMMPPDGSKSVQNYDLQTSTNVYGPFLLTILLRDALMKATKSAETGSVRVVWASSSAADLLAPPGGVVFVPDAAQDGSGVAEKLKLKEDLGSSPSYGQSKAANILLGVECARRWGNEGVISNSLNPGNLRSELARYRSGPEKVVAAMINHPVEMGAWTELFAGWSPKVTPQLNGCYIIPWGRFGKYNSDIQQAITDGKAEKLWNVCESVVLEYM